MNSLEFIILLGLILLRLIPKVVNYSCWRARLKPFEIRYSDWRLKWNLLKYIKINPYFPMWMVLSRNKDSNCLTYKVLIGKGKLGKITIKKEDNLFLEMRYILENWTS